MSTPDLIEASVRAGRPDDAKAAYVYLSGFAATGAPPWAAALAARCRALMSDDFGDAEVEFGNALLAHAQEPRTFDQARTRLLLGEHLRRARRRVDAREHLRGALESFELLDAGPWAERARTELRASGETARKRAPGARSRLSPQELQVGRLVAAGQSNKAVAAQLLLSPRTIDAHLRSIFSKLEISSRMELTRIELGSDVALAP
jgi:DNA-binding CsgD family transcriptional regulator